MNRENTAESQIFIHSLNLNEDILDDQIELENPENNFQKLMALKPDLPAKEFRDILQAMSEHCTFEKKIIKKTSDVEIPGCVRSQQRRRQVFEDYEVIKNYASFQKKKQHFQARKFMTPAPASLTSSKRVETPALKKLASSKRYKTQQPQSPSSRPAKLKTTKQLLKTMLDRSKIITLGAILQDKKNKMIMQDDILNINQEKVTNILNNSEKREKIFQQALLLERLYDIEVNKLKSVGIVDSSSKVPEKFRGVEPKHIRISTQQCKNEADHIRKKYVCKKRKLQFYGHARKIQQSSLKNKKLENLGVLETIMKFNQAKCTLDSSESQRNKVFIDDDLTESNHTAKSFESVNKRPNIYEQDFKIKRLFLKYTCCQTDNPEEMYKYIGQAELLAFFKDFNLTEKLNTNLEIKSFLQQKSQQSKKENQINLTNTKIKYFLFDFLEILYILAAQNSLQKFNCNLQEFLDTHIWKNQEKVVPEAWRTLNQIKKTSQICKYLKVIKFEDNCEVLFDEKATGIKLTKYVLKFVNFNDVLEIMWEIKLFPLKVSKKAIRFAYLYCLSHENGLNLRDFIDFLLVIGIQFSPYEQNEQKVKWIVQQTFKS